MGRHREFVENEVLEAAMFVFWHRGYDGTSIDNLTQATGVARPGLYAVFGNKDAIFRKTLSLYESKYLRFMRDAMSAPTALKVVELMLRGCATLHTLSATHSGCLGLNGALACSVSSEPIRL
jgi:AcrR family transcriptional regulator